jgi:hypothetical protein
MAETYKIVGADTLTAPAAINEKRFIKGDGNQCGAGEKAAGVTTATVEAGNAVGYVFNGIWFVEAGASVTAGQEIESDANGKGIPLNTGKSSGIATNSCSTGQDIRLLIR